MFDQHKIKYYKYHFTDEEISPQIAYTFGDIATLYDNVFKRKENYEIDQHGRIRIKYRIQL